MRTACASSSSSCRLCPCRVRICVILCGMNMMAWARAYTTRTCCCLAFFFSFFLLRSLCFLMHSIGSISMDGIRWMDGWTPHTRYNSIWADEMHGVSQMHVTRHLRWQTHQRRVEPILFFFCSSVARSPIILFQLSREWKTTHGVRLVLL